MNISFKSTFFLVITALAFAETAYADRQFTLQDCYQLSLSTSERLQRSEEDIVIAEAQYQQAVAKLYPQIALNADQSIRDNANFGRIIRSGAVTEDSASPTGGRSGSIGRTQFDATVSVSQQIFNGFREFLIADALEKEKAAIRLDIRRNRELLYRDVAELFYQALGAAAELAVLAKSQKTVNDRIGELQQFRALGKARESEVLAAKSELYDILAEEERTVGLLRETKVLLGYLMGIPAEELKLADEVDKLNLQAVSDYLSQMNSRSDLEAAAIRSEAQKLRLEAASRANWPSVAMTGRAYAFEDPDRTRDWDLLLGFSLPLFDGGSIAATKNQAAAELRSTKLYEAELKRLIERDIRASYEVAEARKKQKKRFSELLAAAKKNYEFQRRDYEFGVVSNLEVLQAIRRTHEAERAVVATKYSYAADLAKLAVAAGGLPQ